MAHHHPDSSRSPDATAGPRRDQVRSAWLEHRRYLLATATRILDDPDGADDVVAEAFARLAAQPEAVRDPRGWLLVVVRRIALDRLRSAHRRLSEPTDPAGPHLDQPNPPDDGESTADPADRITLDDELRHALSVVLDRLSPGERAAFLLHDIFGLPFDEVGQILGRSATACRQLASRARRSIRSTGAADDTTGARSHDPQLDQVAERFVAACTRGDLAGLTRLLRHDVTGWAKRDGVILNEVSGSDQVAQQAIGFFGPRSRWMMIPLTLDRSPSVLVIRDDSAYGVIDLVTDEEFKIAALQGDLLSTT